MISRAQIISTLVLVALFASSLGAQANRSSSSRRASPSLSTSKKDKAALPAIQRSLFEQSQSGEQRLDPAQMRPTRSSQLLRSENEDYNRLNQIIDQQIQELARLTQRTKNPAALGELWLRQAELFVEKADLTKTLIDQKYDRDVRAHKANPKGRAPLLNYKPAQVYNKRAVALYEQFLNRYPRDRRVDQALFFLGYNYFELGDARKGSMFYQRLSKNHPRSNYIVESRFALGEYYFENNDFKTALGHYQFVMKSSNRRLATFSSYKSAWCQFKVGQTRAAIVSLERIIQGGKAAQKGAVELRLDSEARRDMILFYAEGGNAERAVDYFNSLFGAQDGFNQLEKLAYVYSDKGNGAGARTIFSYLIQQKPTQAKAFDYQYQIVRYYSSARNVTIFREEMHKWIRDFGPKSRWYQQNQNNTELVAKSNQLLEQTLRTWTLQQHQTAQNSRGQFSQNMAHDGYRLYFAEFGNSPEAPDLRFFFGELLYDMGRFDEASREYRWVVDNGVNSKYRAQAAANILVSVEKSLPSDAEISKKVGDRLEPVPLDSAVQNYISQATWYITNFSNDKKVAETQFRIGRLYYQYNHFDKAIPYFKTVVKNHSETEYAEYSANLLLDIFNLQKDYDGLEKHSRELLAIPAIARSKTGREIQDLLQKSNFKRAQDLEGQGQFKTSAEQYEAFAAQNPRSDLASMAIFNAAINYSKIGNTSKSISMLEKLDQQKDPRAQDLKAKSSGMLPDLYRNSGRLAAAAAAYVAAGNSAAQDKDKSNHYYNAAVLYEALGQNQNAIANYKRYYDATNSRDKSAVLFNMAKLQRSVNQRTRAIQTFEQFLNETKSVSDKSVEAAYALYELKRSPASERSKWAATVTRLHGQVPEDRKSASAKFPARIELDRAKQVYSELWAIKLNDLKTLKANSDKKISLLESLNQRVATVIRYNSPEEILEAVKLLGDSNLNMYESLINAPMPPELTRPEDIQQYKEGVKQLADPFLAKASEAYELVVQRSSEFETYTEPTDQARLQLSKLKPGSVYEHGQRAVESTQSDWKGL